MPYSVVLLDDHRVVAESFANLLATSNQFRVAGLAHDRYSLMSALYESSVDVLVTDLLMPTGNAAELIPSLKKEFPNLRILVVSGSVDPALVRGVMQAGADGFVTKTADKAELFDAILAVGAGRRYMDYRVLEMDETNPERIGVPELTDRENEVARLILDELTSSQIAERLFISFNTVETHRKHIYQKMGVTTSLGLMKLLLGRSLQR